MADKTLYQLKKLFFDRAEVIAAVGRATAAVLSRAGAFVRRDARHNIRARKKVSRPGQGPSSHTGLLKDLLEFSYDPSARSVVIGPALANKVYLDGDRQPVRGTVPEILESGGAITLLKEQSFPGGPWRNVSLRAAKRRSRTSASGERTDYYFSRRKFTLQIEPRPYMAPAMEKNVGKFPGLWADSIK